jgi:hypothetical protein
LPKPYRCGTCNSIFNSKEALKQHRKVKHRARGLAITAGYLAAGVIIVSYLVFSGALSSISQTLSGQSDGHSTGQLLSHIHARLTVTIDGQEMKIPSNIGILPSLWIDRSLDRYGIGNSSPMHTHDESGVIHIESTVARNYSLGEFFDIWGKTFNEFCIFDKCGAEGSLTVTVNGLKNLEYRNHVLLDKEDIRIEFKSSS